MRNAGANHAIGKIAARRSAETAILKPGSPALFGPEALVGERLIDETVRDLRTPVGPLSPPRQSRWRNAGCREGSWLSRRADRRSSAAWKDCPPPRRLPRGACPSRVARCGSSSTIVCSARLSAIETKSAGPLRLTWSCSTSPKSRRRRGAALRAARCMTVIRPEWDTKDRLLSPARRTYSRLYVSTTMRVPLAMCGGTITRTPLSRMAGL